MRERKIQSLKKKPQVRNTTLSQVVWFLLKAFVIYLAIMAHIPGAFALRAESRSGRSREGNKGSTRLVSSVGVPTPQSENEFIFSYTGSTLTAAPVAEPTLMAQLQTFLKRVVAASQPAAHLLPRDEDSIRTKLETAPVTPFTVHDPQLAKTYEKIFSLGNDPTPFVRQLRRNPQLLKAFQRYAYQGDPRAAQIMSYFSYAQNHFADGVIFATRAVMVALNHPEHSANESITYVLHFLKLAMKEVKRLTQDFTIDVRSSEFAKQKTDILSLIDIMDTLSEKIKGIDKPIVGHDYGVKAFHSMVRAAVVSGRSLYSDKPAEDFSEEEKNVQPAPAPPRDQIPMLDEALLKQLYAFGFRQLALSVIKANPKTMQKNGDGGASYSSRGVQLDWRPQTMQQLPSDEKKLETIISAARSGNHVASAYLSEYFFERYSKDPTPTGKRSLSFWPLVLIEQACLQHELAYYHEKALELYADLPEKHWPTTQIYIVIWHATRFLELATETELGDVSPKVRALLKKYGDKKFKKPVDITLDPYLEPVLDETQDIADLDNFINCESTTTADIKKYPQEKPASFQRVQRSAARGDVQSTILLSYYYFKISDLDEAFTTATQALMLRRAYPDHHNLDVIGWFLQIGTKYLKNLMDRVERKDTFEFELYYPEIESFANVLAIFNHKVQKMVNTIPLSVDMQNILTDSLLVVETVQEKMEIARKQNQIAGKQKEMTALKQKEAWLHIKFGATLFGLALTLWAFIWWRGQHQKQMKRIVLPIKKPVEKAQLEKKSEPVVEQREFVHIETSEEKAVRLAAEKAQREIERQEREQAEQAEKAKNYKDALSYVMHLREVVSRFTVIPDVVQAKMDKEKAKLPDLEKQEQAHEKADNKTRATAQWKKDKKELLARMESCNKYVAHCEETNRIYVEFIKEADALLKNCEEKGGVEQAYPFETNATDFFRAVAGLQTKQTKLDKEMLAISSASVQLVEEQENSEENDRYKKCQKELIKLKKEFRVFSERYMSDINSMRNERDVELIGQCDKAVEICCKWVDGLANKKFDAMEKDYFMSYVESLVEMEADLKSKREEIKQCYEESLVEDKNDYGNNNNNDERFVKRAALPKGSVAHSVGSFLVEVRRDVEQDFPGHQGEKEKRRELKAKAKQEAAAKKREEARNPIAIALDARIRDMQQMLREKDFKDHRLLLHRALQYRMVRLMLLLETIVNQKDEAALKAWYQNLAAHFTSAEYERFAKKFSNRLVHYYFMMGDSAEDFETKGEEHPDPDGLLSCVKECFATREKLSKKLPEKIKKTKLWKLFKDIEKSQPRSADVLFEECMLKFREFLDFHVKFREKYDNPVKLPIFNSACKMLLILIGENFARLCELHPEINTLAKDENAEDPAHQMIIDLNRLRHRRNLEKHEMDLTFEVNLISDDMIKEFQEKADRYCQLLGDLRERVIPRAVVNKK